VDSVDIDVTEAEGTFGTETTTPTCGDQGQQDLLATMLSEARALAGGAASDVNSHPNSQQFADFFGNNDRGAVYWEFDTIAGDLDTAGTRM
jgi:deuterolysin